MAHGLRSQGENIYLIGESSLQIVTCKLPSNLDVLRLLFFNLRTVKLSLRASAKLVSEEVIVFWTKARIPVQRLDHIVTKVEKLYNEWRAIQKHSRRQSDLDKKNETDFIDRFNDLFDVAHAEALSMIQIPEDKVFLLNQRKKGRVGYMLGIDKKLADEELKAQEKQQKIQSRKEKESANLKRICKCNFLSLCNVLISFAICLDNRYVISQRRPEGEKRFSYEIKILRENETIYILLPLNCASRRHVESWLY